ncbi:probable LRR receptor-like serine/threonine-protein kinase At2g24230 isoform X2 [Phalaenopsis equestris]|uniref:probable LRR receptor-like serine/threonine-protein kinase At2g24230 isoform X2 n=1 Tax=Phalaenopsis equestris TaxID=78828 RepID=UPI0009E2A268|nr:probable LRR receptor-like serine/threonine-protein kinase At2g24230 isoform X2 [Phalaenopsis equestris]
MGSGYLASSLFLVLFFKCLAFQQPNSDGFFLADFLKKMGAKLPSTTSSSVCSWSGVSCDSNGEYVIGFVASDLGLSGSIPENTIGKLSKLQALDLSINNITKLSSDLWGLGSSLKSLNLSMNRIQDSLLNNIGNFGNLESLDLSQNDFFGEIPAGISSMTNLRFLNVSRNAFGGKIPEGIADCKYLVTLDLSVNKLSGSLPAAFKNLSFLDLSRNQIQGAMPDLSGFKSIHHLNVSNNLLQDSITLVFQATLEVLDLSNNQFSQVNLGSSFNFSSLVYLDISGNNLNGDLSSILRQASLLKHLNFANNRFSQQKFPQIHDFYMLEYLNLSETNLTGNCPSEISQLVGLKTLDISHNQLSGKVPNLMMVNLTILDISSNNLTGEIPSQLLEKLPRMELFNFSNNNLTFCAKKFLLERFNSSFIGSQNSCPLAANPDAISSINVKHKRKSTRSWAVKQLSYKEEQNVEGPYSFRTDSTAWVADVRVATSVPVVMFEKPLLNFTFADLLASTSNFDRGTLLSEGSLGPVYRGILPGGIQVALKVLVNGAALTDQDVAKELERLGRIKHPNIVPLTGYCLAGDQRIAIYEYMENGNLQNLLHDLPLGVQTAEDWSTDTWENETSSVQNITTEGVTTWRFRHRIALGVARALAFLHHGCFPQVVHRDVKASNIYLDSNLEPRLSHFGLEKVVGNDLDEISGGSPGYVPPELSDPENASSSAATPKIDVFGFGVVLFELITGRKPVGETSLVDWARALVKKSQCSLAIDPKIRETGPEKQMEEALRIAYLCTADLPSKRPSMQQIVGLLKDMEPVARD